MNRTLIAFTAPGLLLVTLLAAGCKKETPPTDAPIATATEAAPPPPAPIAQAEPPVDPSTVPTEEDFEDEAAKSISSKNLNEELDKLEKEIQSP